MQGGPVATLHLCSPGQLKRLKTVLYINVHSSITVPVGPQTKETGKGRGVKVGEQRGGGEGEG